MPASNPPSAVEQVGAHQRGRARARRRRRGRRRAAPGRARPARRSGPGARSCRRPCRPPAGGRVDPLDELGADDAGVGPVGLLDHHLDHVGVEPHVVVAEQVEGRALDRAQHLVGRGAEPGVALEAAQVGVGHDRGDPIAHGRVAAAVDHEQRGVRVALRRDAGQRLLEPAPGSWATMTITTGGTTWGSPSGLVRLVRLHVLVGGIHDGPRLVARPSAIRLPLHRTAALTPTSRPTERPAL